MLTPQQVLRITIEIILCCWEGWCVARLSGHILFDRRKPGWLLLSIAIILWGVRALYKPGQMVVASRAVDARLSLNPAGLW